MTKENAYRVDDLSVVDFIGNDTAAILHTLTTNHVNELQPNESCETFVTNVKGKTVAHGMMRRLADRFRFLGSSGQSEALVKHVDRYIIREDCRPEIRDKEFCGFVFDDVNDWDLIDFDGDTIVLIPAPWTGPNSGVALLTTEQTEHFASSAAADAIQFKSEAAFHDARIQALFPWFGPDLNDTNLPQEADRDQFAISFTKGCYLGQETVARLDALGQVQRKLVRWRLTGFDPADPPKPGVTLECDGKPVARLTSVSSPCDSGSGEICCEAIGFARRSHFNAGSVATGGMTIGTVI